jgi:glycosyltransferase involved in cell wall biosynthesis
MDRAGMSGAAQPARSIVLLGYDPGQPSFRHRMASLVEPLAAAGWTVHVERFPSGRYGLRTFERRALFRSADVVVLHQIKLSAMEARLLAAFSRRRVFDVDDAIYVRKPRRLGESPDDSMWRRRKFAATCRAVDVVAAGNEVLARVAAPAAHAIEVLPTSIDVSAYRPGRAASEGPVTIAWIGSPENLIYVEMIRPALARLCTRHPTLKIRIICSRFPQWPDVRIEPVAWSAATEAESLAAAHIGIMPLTDDAWSRGKCAFKLLQYMAASLPCVASPVGANTEAVIDGFNGFHAADVPAWERHLERLIESPELRATMGANGHAHVAQRYSMRGYQARYLELLARLAAV